MKFFIDTANLDQIREANELGVLDGVTTNPSLMAKEGLKGVENQRKPYIEICEMVVGRPESAYCGESPLYRNRYQGNQALLRQRHPYELYARFFSRAGVVGGQSRCDLCVSLCRPFGRHSQ